MTDQAQQLRELMRKRRGAAQVVAITSGKGGVGKTNTAVNLAIALSARDQRVLVMDADLGLANVEVVLGLNSFYNLEHVVDGEKSLREIIVEGPGEIRIIPGSSGLAKVANLTSTAREKLIQDLKALANEMDFIIIDTMAGIGRNAVAFATAADETILITTPEPSAIVDAYAMLKTIFNSRADAVISLLVNMAANEAQAQAVTEKLTRVASQYLDRPLNSLGFLPRDTHVNQAVMQSRPFIITFPGAPVSRHMLQLADRLLAGKGVAATRPAQRDNFFKRVVSAFGLAGNG